jgi:hypothetical protein
MAGSLAPVHRWEKCPPAPVADRISCGRYSQEHADHVLLHCGLSVILFVLFVLDFLSAAAIIGAGTES